MSQEEIKKAFSIKIGSVRRLLIDARENEKSYESEVSRLHAIEISPDFDDGERKSRMNWQRNVIADHASSIMDSQRRLHETLADLETFIDLCGDSLANEDKDESSVQTVKAARDFLVRSKSSQQSSQTGE